MKLTIIIPVYNEEQTISELVERVRAVDLGAMEKEIIIANDGSSDRTREVINSSEWAGDPRIHIGLGKWTDAVPVSIRWCGGATKSYSLASGTYHEVRQ